MVLHSIVLYCIVLHCIVWYLMLSYCIQFHCTVLYAIALLASARGLFLSRRLYTSCYLIVSNSIAHYCVVDFSMRAVFPKTSIYFIQSKLKSIYLLPIFYFCSMSSINICLVALFQSLHSDVKLEAILGETFAIFENFVNSANWAPTFMPPKKALGMLFQGLIFRQICTTNFNCILFPFSHNICFIPVSGCLQAILAMTGDIILLSGPFPILLLETYFPSGYRHIRHI